MIKFVYLSWKPFSNDRICPGTTPFVSSSLHRFLHSSYDCLISMKIDKILDILHQGSYGAYIILKLLFKNRQVFIKVVL